ncbi:MAG: VIT and VWA domain-containing protein [Gemmataceae bacterium]|nr:VIT and VWA domain-containing protein [Gemmataceae bacterium]MDW8265786.1 VIT and VWA domain-containing protein [Gemmataceae bacterium]
MRRFWPVPALLLLCVDASFGRGILLPTDKTVSPLAMVHHRVRIAIDDQVAITSLEQTFRNHTDRQLEATYVFPVPPGASVNQFSMWVDGKEVTGELLDAAKARSIYTDIVRRTQDPGLLEYLGNNLFRVRVFPVAPRADQRVALRFTSVAPKDANLIEYVYPLRTDGKANRTLEEFSIQATIKSQHPILNVYSPTHVINLSRKSDHEVHVQFEKQQALLDRDFQMFYSLSDQDVGLTLLTHRPSLGEPGTFMLLMSPRVAMSRPMQVPRDMVLVVDTSGSMAGAKMEQAKKAVKFCLDQLGPQDRVAILRFSTQVSAYREGLANPDKARIEDAKRWVDGLTATGGTAINAALLAALDLRTNDDTRTFTIIFFTDGQPTVGETNPGQILKNVLQKNTAGTRIFTLGVGDDVNATLLDALADQTRAVSTYVRPSEDLEVKVSSLYDKISHPVLANLRLTVSGDIRLDDMYPPRLPDLFHGGQLVVLGRYSGHGSAALTLTGKVGGETRQFTYDVSFPEKTGNARDFVEHVWARRKVGYLLDQIRANGEQKELVEEVVALAKKYGIATPYTSYLIVPDAPLPVARPGRPLRPGWEQPVPEVLRQPGAPGGVQKVADVARSLQDRPGELEKKRAQFEQDRLERGAADKENADEARRFAEANERQRALAAAQRALQLRNQREVQAGRLGVDLSIYSNQLRNQQRLEPTAQRKVAGRDCLEIGGVWIDVGFTAQTPTITIKALSEAYFRILERQPQMKEVYRLGNHLVWLTPSGTALVIDTEDGVETIDDAAIDRLFVAAK